MGSALKAAESLVLLKNNGVLPLKPGVRVAVIGPLGDATRVLRGNYSSPNSAPPISVVDGLRRAMPEAKVTLVPFAASITDGDLVTDGNFLTPDGQPGLRAVYYNAIDPAKPRGERTFSARPVVTRIEANLQSSAMQLKRFPTRTRWCGRLLRRAGKRPLQAGRDRGERRAGNRRKAGCQVGPLFVVGRSAQAGRGRAEEGRALSAALRDGRQAARAGPVLEAHHPRSLGRSGAGAADADVLVAVVGLTSDLEGEEMPLKIEGFDGGDKTGLELPMDQRELLIRARTLGKPLVVVTMNGSPIDLSGPGTMPMHWWRPGIRGRRAAWPWPTRSRARSTPRAACR
jgi:beta-glucosidase